MTYSAFCKFKDFYATHILREINFGRLQKVVNFHFNNFMKILKLKISKIPKNSKSRATKMVKVADFETLELLKIDFT